MNRLSNPAGNSESGPNIVSLVIEFERIREQSNESPVFYLEYLLQNFAMRPEATMY